MRIFMRGIRDTFLLSKSNIVITSSNEIRKFFEYKSAKYGYSVFDIILYLEKINCFNDQYYHNYHCIICLLLTNTRMLVSLLAYHSLYWIQKACKEEIVNAIIFPIFLRCQMCTFIYLSQIQGCSTKGRENVTMNLTFTIQYCNFKIELNVKTQKHY